MDYAGIIIERNDGKLLFQLRDNKKNIPNPNKWGIFGGGIEKNETPKKAALRELKEELNFALKEKELTKLIVLPTPGKKYYLFFIKLKRNLKFKLNEGASMRFMSRKELFSKNNVVPVVKTFFRFYPLIKNVKKINL